MSRVSEDENIKALKKVIKAKPSAELVTQLGKLYLEQNEFEKAEKEFKNALGLEDGFEGAKIGLAWIAFKKKRFVEAKEVLEKIVFRNRKSDEAFYLLGKIEEELKEYSKALDNYKKAYRANGKSEYQEAMERLEGKIPVALLNKRVGASEEMDVGHLELPDVTFDDVAGLERAKEKIRELIILPLTHPEIYKAYKKKTGGGLLFFGPPGCGKTYLAKATAGEVKAAFINLSLNDVLDMWLGESEKKLSKVFDEARKHSPSVIFIDEFDALGARREKMHGHGGHGIVNQLLSEMDGVKSDNSKVLVIGATNMPWQVDTALKRPGRFDHVIYVPPPNMAGREAIFKIHCREKPLEDEIDFEELARKTKGYSGADLAKICDEAANIAMKEAMKSGKIKKIGMDEFRQALAEVKPSIKEWMETAKTYAKYSSEKDLYSELLDEDDFTEEKPEGSFVS